jgi:hypothetical protein
VLAAQGKIDYPVFLFANVGDDSEHPDTLRYVNEVAKPYAAAHGIELYEVHTTRYGERRTLYQETVDPSLRAVPIPIRFDNGAFGMRSCTKNYKAIPIAREIKRLGATLDTPAQLGLGISIDEYQRMNTSRIAWQVFEYPLIDLRLARDGCRQIIERAGLPTPRKSACWFCPYTRVTDWRYMKDRQPDLFQRAVIFERDIQAKQRNNGKPPVFLTGGALPLDAALAGEQAMMEFDDLCDSGYCMT